MRAFPDHVRTVTVNGASLAYAEQGEGDAIVFVHGTSQDLRTWHGQAGALAGSGSRTIVYSRRYARPNDDIPPGQDDQMAPHVDDLASLLRALDAAPADLVGNSWGAFIALLLAIREPGLVRTLTLCEPPVIPLFLPNQPGAVDLIRLLLRGPITAVRIIRFGLGVVEPTRKAYERGDRERAGRIFGRAVLGKEAFASLPEDRRQMLDENAAAEIAQFLGAGFPPLRAEDVRNVRVPVLLVTGARSAPLLRATLTDELHRLLPHAERARIAEASHMMHEDDPSAFNVALAAFLKRARAAAAR